MGFYTDFDFTIEGIRPSDSAVFEGGEAAAAPFLPAGHTVKVEFQAIAGPIHILGSVLDARDPDRMRQVGPRAAGEFVEEWNRLPFTVELFAPGQGRVAVWRDDVNGWVSDDASTFEYVVPAGPSEVHNLVCHITNRGRVRGRARVSVHTVALRTPVRYQPIALPLLNHAYRVILEALAPSARANGSRVTWSFGEELKAYFGADIPVLGEHVIPLPDGASVDGRLVSFALHATSGQTLLDAVHARWQAIDADPGPEPFARTLNDRWRKEWEERVRPDMATIHLEAAFSNIEWSYEKQLLAIKFRTDGVLRDVLVDTYLAFEEGLLAGHVLALSPAKFEGGALDVGEDLGIIEELSTYIEEEIPRFITPALPYVGRYLGEALARLCLREGMFLSVSADGSAWTVRHALTPDSVTGGTGGTGEPGGVPAPAGGGPRGQLPADFVVHSPESLARLDKVETIVVLMMENRSFDHMLGHLRQLVGEQYEGLTGRETNLVAGRQEPVRMRLARDVMPGVVDERGPVPVTAIQVSPQHDYLNIADQIAGGAMSGFAQDVEERSRGAADLVMTYYTEAELVAYYELAERFAVCDHWFAAHPGGTWPNRWATLTGTTPMLVNPELNDPGLAYVEGETILSWLSAYGIEWRLFESDLSIVRTFNRHRIDGQRVVPLHLRPPEGLGIGEGTTFWDLAARGALPPVVFIEPNFSDIPPLSSANDDLAPVDLKRGQCLVAQIVDTLVASPQWGGVMFVITYDEHGGFYDHVAPPGTPLGPPEWHGKIPRIHPDGPDHLGVRVPAIVVSPLISAGTVAHDVFDHTSLIKTILLRHRNSLDPDVFTAFGPRVNEAAHLGLVLDLDTPRTDRPPPLTPDCCPLVDGGLAPGAPDPTEFSQSLRHAFLPAQR